MTTLGYGRVGSVPLVSNATSNAKGGRQWGLLDGRTVEPARSSQRRTGFAGGAAATRRSIEPATGEELGRVGRRDADDVARPRRRASEAQRAWATTGYQERAAILRRAGDLFKEHADEIQGWIVRETGAIPPKAQLETWFAASTCYEAAGAALAPLRRAAPDARPRPEHVAARCRSAWSASSRRSTSR